MWTGTATIEGSMEIPENLSIEIPQDLAVPLLGIYPKIPKTIWKDNIHPCVNCNTIFGSQNTKTS